MPELTLFEPETASEAYFKSRNDYLNMRRKEATPDDPPTSLEFSINNAKGWKLIQSARLEAWHLWRDGKIIAELFLVVDLDESNLHLMSVGLQILKPYRNRGYTKPLLEKAVAFAQKYRRTLISGHTTSFVPEGEGFALHLGATKGLEMSMNQLFLNDLDERLLADWLALANTKAREFEMGFWGNHYPEEDLHAVAELFGVMNSAPRDDLHVEDWKTKPEELREVEAYNAARGVERWALYVRHKPSQALAGFTLTHWFPENPTNLEQGDTGVLPQYRGNGLGRWLKAAMIQKVLVERPEVKHIRTENADSNAPMRAINKALGFKLYKSETLWQLGVARLKDYLS